MTYLKDKQKEKVYSWENQFIAPLDRTEVHFNNIQGIVNYIWSNEGCLYPPNVVPMPKNIKKVLADAERTTLRFKDKTYTWIIIHELSHAFTTNVDGLGNGHGGLFMGVYLKLLSKYLNLDYNTILASALKADLSVNINAKPIFQ